MNHRQPSINNNITYQFSNGKSLDFTSAGRGGVSVGLEVWLGVGFEVLDWTVGLDVGSA